MSVQTREVLVANATPTRLDNAAVPYTGRRFIEIQNRGPNAISLCIGESTGFTLAKGRTLPAGSSVVYELRSGTPVYALATTGDQLTGAATIVLEF